MKTKNSYFSKTLVILMAIMMVFTMMPSMAFAAGETETTETVTVKFNFDISSFGTEEALKTAGISQIPGIAVQIEKGSTLQDALKKYVSENPRGNSFTGLDTESAYVTQINDIGAYSLEEDSAFVRTMNKLGVDSIPSDFQYAGWTYSGDGLTGWGLDSDRANQDVTVNFRYTLYFAAGIDNEWRNFDWEFLDAYEALMQKNEEAQNIADNSYDGFTETQKQKL